MRRRCQSPEFRRRRRLVRRRGGRSVPGVARFVQSVIQSVSQSLPVGRSHMVSHLAAMPLALHAVEGAPICSAPARD